MNAASEAPRRHWLTVDEYHRMDETGILAPDARVELIDGEIIDMAPIGSRHAGIVSRLSKLFERSVGEHVLVWAQNPVRLGDHSEPEPDIALLKPREDFYTRSHPAAGDVLLLVEVSDSTLAYDRNIKAPLYARHSIVETWLVDVDAKRLVTYSNLERGRYEAEHVHGTDRADDLAALRTLKIGALPDTFLDLGELFRDID